MRILELTDLYPPVIGGLERYVRLLSDSLASRGHDVAVATTATPATAVGARREGDVEVHRLSGWQQRLFPRGYGDASRPFHPTLPDPGMVRGLTDVIRSFRPDVLHAHSWSLFSALPLVRRLDLPVVITAHDYGLICAKKTLTFKDGSVCSGPGPLKCLACASDHYGPVKGVALASGLAASARLLRNVTTFTAVSRYVAERLAKVITPLTGRQVDVLHSFVPDGLRSAGMSSPKPHFLPEGEFLLYVGVLSDHKGVRVLLKAHSLLANRVPLVLLGTQHDTTPPAEELPTDVVLRTDVPHEQVIAAMTRAALTLAPSIWPDPLPMTVSEAQLCGSPVIGSAVGGIPEQIKDGVTGILVPPGDARVLAARIDELLADRARRLRMSEAGKEWATRFTLGRLTERTVGVLADAARKS